MFDEEPGMEAHEQYRYEIERLESKLSEAEAEIEDTRNRSCCKYPDYCDGECTCKICAPDIHIAELESQLTAAEAKIAEAIRLLRILLSVKITDSDGNVALGISETKYQ